VQCVFVWNPSHVPACGIWWFVVCAAPVPGGQVPMVAEVAGEVIGVCLLSDAGCSAGHIASLREAFDIDAYWSPVPTAPAIGGHG
jgi:hypothetical protein